MTQGCGTVWSMRCSGKAGNSAELVHGATWVTKPQTPMGRHKTGIGSGLDFETLAGIESGIEYEVEVDIVTGSEGGLGSGTVCKVVAGIG